MGLALVRTLKFYSSVYGEVTEKKTSRVRPPPLPHHKATIVVHISESNQNMAFLYFDYCFLFFGEIMEKKLIT